MTQPIITDSFVVAEWQDPGGPVDAPPRLIAPRHVHFSDDEARYVLEGTLRVQVGLEEVEAGVGASVIVPKAVPHTYWNAGPGRLRYLLLMTPRIYSLIQAIHKAEDRSPAALKILFGKYDSELLDT